MKEILTQLFGEAVTDEALKAFNAELGKKFVAKADFNAKADEIKALKTEKQSLEAEITKLNENAKNGEDVKAELEALKTQIAADKAQAENERIQQEKEAKNREMFEKAVKEYGKSKDDWQGAFTEDGYYNKFIEAISTEENAGRSHKDVLHDLVKNDKYAFKGVEQIRLAGGTARPTGKSYNSKEEIMAIKDRRERRQAIAENSALFGFNKE